MELPELPEAAMIEQDPYGGTGTLEWYDADQMRAYAAAAVEAERERLMAAVLKQSRETYGVVLREHAEAASWVVAL